MARVIVELVGSGDGMQMLNEFAAVFMAKNQTEHWGGFNPLLIDGLVPSLDLLDGHLGDGVDSCCACADPAEIVYERAKALAMAQLLTTEASNDEG